MIGPETEVESSWKRAYVYGFDKIDDPTSHQHWLVFYNGRLDTDKYTSKDKSKANQLTRDGWRVGREAIGVSRLDMTVIDPLA